MLSHFSVNAQADTSSPAMEIAGQIMMDMGYDFGRVAPDWYDVMRPTKLLDDDGQPYQPKGNFFMGVRQTNLGIKNYFTTGLGKLTTRFEFELFGTGANVGQTTFKLRYAYAQLGKWVVGQTNSVFMDSDLFPNTIEYWGPCGIVAFRSIQVQYMPVKKENTQFTISIEQPGATADQGQYGKYFLYGNLLDGVKFRFPVPDVAAAYKRNGSWGHVQLAGIARYIKWEDVNRNSSPYNFSGNALAWGLNLSSKIGLAKNIHFKGSVTGGEGIQNYMDDADADIGVDRQYDNITRPIDGKAIPMLALVAFVDIDWNNKFSSSIGYSRLGNKTRESQLSTAFKTGQYAVANLLYYPAQNCMIGAELQWAARQNNDFKGDPVFQLPAEKGNSASNVKLQCSFRYLFHHSFKKNK